MLSEKEVLEEHGLKSIPRGKGGRGKYKKSLLRDGQLYPQIITAKGGRERKLIWLYSEEGWTYKNGLHTNWQFKHNVPV